MKIERFGDVLLLERLASGGMAEVFRAKQIGFDGFEKTVAVKRILPEFASKEKFKELFSSEAKLCGKLHHPNIVQVFSNGEHHQYLYLVMEFIDGKNLRTLLSKTEEIGDRIPIDFACYIISEALKGLDYAHHVTDENNSSSLNIVHQDISPQNIMLGYDGSIKVVDFGIAKANNNLETSRKGVIRGKFSYMSPEQASGDALDLRSDIFSLGIVFWEMLAQKRLFFEENKDTLLEKVKKCEIPNLRDINPLVPYSLEKIVVNALEKNKKDRYQNAIDFYTDVINYLSDRHPNFNSVNFSKHFKKLFADEIQAEKLQRNSIQTLVPTFVALEKKSQLKEENTVISEEKNTDTYSESIKVATQAPSLPPADLTLIQLSTPSSNMTPIRVIREETPRLRTSNANPYAEKNRRDTEQSFELSSVIKALFFIFIAVGTALFLNQKPNEKIAVLQEKIFKKSEQIIDKFAGPLASREPSATSPAKNTSSPISQSPAQATKDAEAKLKEQVQPLKNKENSNYIVWGPKKLEVAGFLNIKSTPDANLITIDGIKLVDAQLIPVKTPVTKLDLAPGTYELKLENTTFNVSYTQKISIIEGKTITIKSLLKK